NIARWVSRHAHCQLATASRAVPQSKPRVRCGWSSHIQLNSGRRAAILCLKLTPPSASARPAPPIRGPAYALQMHVVCGRAAAQRAADDHMVSGLQIRRADALLFETAWIGPLSAELALYAAAVVGSEVHPRVWIAVFEADHVSLQGDHLVFVVVTRKRMVCVRRGRGHQGSYGQ